MSLSSGQISRILIGVILLALIIIIYFPQLLYTFSSTAIVNARLISITASISGFIEDSPPLSGAKLESGEKIATIENKNADKTTLHNLQIEYTTVKERLSDLLLEKDKLTQLLSTLEKSQKNYVASLEGRLLLDIHRAELRQQELYNTLLENKNLLEQKEELFKKGFTSKTIRDNAYYNYERSKKVSDQAEMDTQRLRSELRDLRSGIYINSDGRTDESYQKQKINDLLLHQQENTSRISETEQRLHSLSEAVDSERKRVDSLTRTVLSAPLESVVWKSFFAKGNFVEKGQPVVDLVDCQDLFIDLTLHESYFDKIHTGDTVSVRLTGSSIDIPGTVKAIRGSRFNNNDSLHAAAIHHHVSEKEMRVIISIDPKKLKEKNNDYCQVGRHAVVTFDKNLFFQSSARKK